MERGGPCLSGYFGNLER
uniref:Uncharacterized protein n=1 Tax=Anguilla anguilla TaxID=7936 RepID=A0A0E9TZW1_ANGAN